MGLRSFIICIGVFLSFSSLLQAQAESGVGINTTNPRTTLEVAGDTYMVGDLDIATINPILQTDKVALLGQIGGDFVKDLSTQSTGAAIAYFQQYRLINLNGDWIKDLNLNIPDDDYVVTIISAFFNQELDMGSTRKEFFTIPFISATIISGKWHITADYSTAKNTVAGEWIISTMILSRDFSKILPEQTVLMNDKSSKKAGSPIID